MNEDGRWITTKYGNKVFIRDKDVDNYMNDKIRSKSNKNNKYTEKDIKVLRNYDNSVRGYELNNMYLLKKSDGTNTGHSWIINKTKDQIPTLPIYYSTGWNKKEDDGEIIKVSSFKEGKEKLIKLANKKK